MTGAELNRLAADLGLDVVGAARAEPYLDTEQRIRDRRARGLFADMRFTMARPEVSCHPEHILDGARTVVAAALCYFADGAEPGTDEGRLPRYTWRDEYALLRERLERLGRALGGSYRVLVDENDHVDREAAVRAGIAFYGKNTMAITRRYGSWVVLGALVTDVEIEPSPALGLDCGSCRLCIDACPTGALDEPGVLDATKCLLVLDAGAGSRARGVQVGASRFRLRLRHLPGRLPVEPRGREEASWFADSRGGEADGSAARLARGGRRGADRRLRPSLRSAKRGSLAAAKRADRCRKCRQRRAREERGALCRG